MTGRTTTAGGSRRRPSRFQGAGLLAAALLLTACAPSGAGTPAAGPASTGTLPSVALPSAAAPGTPAPAGTTAPHAAPPASALVPIHPATLQAPQTDPAPTSLTVEGTAIDMPVQPGGVSDGGAMEIPDAFDRAAWYRFGPAPGASQGAAVIAGHIDTTSDRAPFSALKSLGAGTVIRVGRDGAPPLTYRVTRVELKAKDKFDGGALFRRTGPHELKVVTCGGRWLDERMDYSDNVIVTAVPG